MLCASTIDSDIRDAVMLKAQLIHRCTLHHPPLRGRYRYLAQWCAINICRNNQAVDRTDNTWYGKENEKKTVNTQVQMHNLAKKCEKAAKLMTKFFRNSC